MLTGARFGNTPSLFCAYTRTQRPTHSPLYSLRLPHPSPPTLPLTPPPPLPTQSLIVNHQRYMYAEGQKLAERYKKEEEQQAAELTVRTSRRAFAAPGSWGAGGGGTGFTFPDEGKSARRCQRLPLNFISSRSRMQR
jgi:hypothetical protein